MARALLVAALALALGACVQAVGGVDPGTDVGADADAAGAADGGDASVDAMTDAVADALDAGAEADAGGPIGEAPMVRITTPVDGSAVDAETVLVTGTASDDRGVARVFVRSGPNVALPATSSDGFRTWTAEVPAGVGTFEVVATAWDVDGLQATAEDRVLLTRETGVDLAPPEVFIDAPADGSAPLQTTVLVQGRVVDDVGVVEMQTWIDGERVVDRPVETVDGFATWARLVTLTPGLTQTVRLVAIDGAGNEGEALLTLTGRATLDREPPTVDITAPLDGADPGVDVVRVVGSARDDNGVRSVRVRVEGGDDAGGDWVDAVTTDGWATWSVDVPLGTGAARIEARATDTAGLAASAFVDVDNTYVAEWGTERAVFLRARPFGERPEVTMVLDRDGIPEVMSEEVQRSIVLLEADTTGLLRNTLEAVKSACGDSWQQDNADPRHDCDLTPLGRTFVGADGTWQSSPEYAMVRLLTMTPANVEVAGTSIAGLQELADGGFFGITIGGGFSQILADGLGIARTDEIVQTEPALEALRTQVLAPHPATTDQGFMPVTMYDALRDLTPMSETFGPAGDHPGILVPGSSTRAQVLEPDFSLTLVAVSNLRWFDGIDLGEGKEYMAMVVDETGPTLDDVLEFDFTDPERFVFDGLVEAPRGDLRFQILENDAYVPSCSGDRACLNNVPGSPLNDASIWAMPPWEVEHVFARASYNAYRERTFQACYINFLGCQAQMSIGVDGLPTGWASFDILFDLGSPPQDQYIWELITEVAQVALHDVQGRTIPEGSADVAFDMRDLDVGLRADDLREAMRPFLQGQAPEISRLLLGDYRRTNGAIDLFYRLGNDGRPYLMFVADSDPLPTDDYAYPSAGFYTTPELVEADRLSRLVVPGSGDTEHQKLRLDPGRTTVYTADDEGYVYRLVIDVPEGDATEITVRVARRSR